MGGEAKLQGSTCAMSAEAEPFVGREVQARGTAAVWELMRRSASAGATWWRRTEPLATASPGCRGWSEATLERAVMWRS